MTAAIQWSGPVLIGEAPAFGLSVALIWAWPVIAATRNPRDRGPSRRTGG